MLTYIKGMGRLSGKHTSLTSSYVWHWRDLDAQPGPSISLGRAARGPEEQLLSLTRGSNVRQVVDLQFSEFCTYA